MPINQISTPNLATDLVNIANIIAGLSAPISFDTYINPCFNLKPTQDCDALILFDNTDYQELGTVDLNDVTITFSYGYMTDCGCEYICSGLPFTPNSQHSMEGLTEDRVYGATIEMSYVVGGITYTKTVQVAYEKDCCSDLFEELACKMLSKMNRLVSTICKYAVVGRLYDTEQISYLRISNLYWLYQNSNEPCEDRDKVFCIYNKIK